MPTRPHQRRAAAPTPAPEISVVLPVHDEAGALEYVIRRIADALDGESHEIVLVDDGSRDASWLVMLQLRTAFPQLRGIRFTRNFGHQAAILAGLVAARGDAVIMMDADGQHPPELLPALISCWRSGAPVVQAIRTGTADEGVLKSWSSRLFYRVFTALAGVEIVRGSADFRLLSRPVVNHVLSSAGPLLFLRGLIPWLGFPAESVPFKVEHRVAGRSSYDVRRMLRLSLSGVLGFSINPLRLASALGVGVSLVAFAYLAYIVGIWLTSDQVVPGWASTAGLLALLGGIQLLTLGILGEYVGRLFMARQDRPSFVIHEQFDGAEARAGSFGSRAAAGVGAGG
ncbi:MAG TPA: glycosyltransferase family 2 protein [Gemmatimonadaceae bacterium]|nr:glycosyltransferase family 2 protein [Gemmatimonadaceae bacterium]